MNRLRNLLNLRQLAVLAVLLLAYAVMAQPMTYMISRIAPGALKSISPALAPAPTAPTGADKSGKQNRAEAIQATFTNNAVITIPADFSAEVKAGNTVAIPLDVDNVNVDLTDDVQRALAGVGDYLLAAV